MTAMYAPKLIRTMTISATTSPTLLNTSGAANGQLAASLIFRGQHDQDLILACDAGEYYIASSTAIEILIDPTIAWTLATASGSTTVNVTLTAFRG